MRILNPNSWDSQAGSSWQIQTHTPQPTRVERPLFPASPFFNKPINIDSDLVATCSPNIFFHSEPSWNYKKLISRFPVWPEGLSFSIRSPRGLIAIIMNEERHFVFFPACWQTEEQGWLLTEAMLKLKRLDLLLTLGGSQTWTTACHPRGGSVALKNRAFRFCLGSNSTMFLSHFQACISGNRVLENVILSCIHND